MLPKPILAKSTTRLPNFPAHTMKAKSCARSAGRISSATTPVSNRTPYIVLIRWDFIPYAGCASSVRGQCGMRNECVGCVTRVGLRSTRVGRQSRHAIEGVSCVVGKDRRVRGWGSMCAGTVFRSRLCKILATMDEGDGRLLKLYCCVLTEDDGDNNLALDCFGDSFVSYLLLRGRHKNIEQS